MIKCQSEAPKGNALRRLTVLSSMVSSLIRGGRASLQAIGTNMESETDLESRIKQAKRWLNSKWTDIDVHFIPYIRPIVHSLSHSQELLLAIDGSTVGKDCMALMISILWRGRAIPICWLVRKAPKGHFPQHMHVALIQQLAELFQGMVPDKCRIILLGDGEFDGNDVQQSCKEFGWDYVFKTAKDTLIADNVQMQHAGRFDSIAPSPGCCSFFMPDVYFTAQGFGTVNAVYWHDRRYQHPLYLLTNLDCAAEAEYFYRRRYRIETFFGDIKSRGFNIQRTKICNPETLFNLLIVASLAFIPGNPV